MILNEFYKGFTKIQEDRNRVERYIQRYNAKADELKEYLIAFTPRSGSSWLQELLSQTRLAGHPGEWFNHYHLPAILSKYRCSTIQDYIRCIKADHSSPNGYFGLEATFFQLRLVLQGCDFEALFREPKIIYLIRKDFVAQGISLYKAVETGYFHSTQPKNGKTSLIYNPERIKYWILHILQQESYWEQFFLEQNLSPLRLTYEELVDNPSATVDRIFQQLGLTNVEANFPQNTAYQKIADRTNAKFHQLFSEEMSQFIQTCKANRGKPELLNLKTSV